MATIRQQRGKWQAIVRRKGFPNLTKTFELRRDAERWARNEERMIDHGTWIDTAPQMSLTLKDALDRYATEVSPEKKGTETEGYRIKKWKQQPIAEAYLGSIRSKDVATYRDKRLAAGAAANTVRLELALLSHLFSVAAKEWGMESLANPVAKIRMPRVSNSRNRRIQTLPTGTDSELDAILAASQSPYLRTVIELAVETAMRRSEIVSLEWPDIDLSQRYAHLRDTKNGTPRVVPLSAKAISIIEAIPKAGNKLFKITPHALSTAFSRAQRKARRNYVENCERLGADPDPEYLVGLHIHDLRHEATSRMFELGLNTMEVASITGHKTLQMLRRYTHLTAGHLADKLDQPKQCPASSQGHIVSVG